jgi:N-methylhydantoinase B/oxoprolinase/acetone carboxylase alpha subunit
VRTRGGNGYGKIYEEGRKKLDEDEEEKFTYCRVRAAKEVDLIVM